MKVEAEIQERTQAFLTDLITLVRQSTIQSLQEVLGGGGTAALVAPARRRRGRPAKGAAAPAADGAMASKIASHVASSPGATAGQIASAVGSDSKSIAGTVSRFGHSEPPPVRPSGATPAGWKTD